MSNRNNGGVPVQVMTLCKQYLCVERGVVINPTNPHFGGVDVDIDWIERCDCPSGKCRNESI